MDRREITYLIDIANIKIERRTGESAKLAKQIHPGRCFDKALEAKQAIINHYKRIRDEAQENVKKAYLVTWSTITTKQ